MPELFLDGSASWTDGSATVDGSAVFVDDAAGSKVDGSATIVVDVAAQLLPGQVASLVEQRAGIEIRVDGTPVPAERLHGDWRLSVSIDRPVQVFEFSTWSKVGDRYFEHDPLECLGPSLGVLEVDVDGIYELDDGRQVRFPLLRGGVADLQHRHAIGDVTIETFQVLDRAGRLDRQNVTANYPAGGGLRRDEVAGELLKLAGATAGQLGFDQMAVRAKPLSLVEAPPLEEINASLFEVEGRRLVHNPKADAYESPALRPAAADPVTLDERVVLDVSPAEVELSGDVLTRVCADGTEELLPEAGTGLASRKQRYFRRGDWDGNWQRYRQDGAGVLTQVGGWPRPITTALLASSVETYQEACGISIRRVTESFGHVGRRQARYRVNGAALDPIDGAYVPDGATALDESLEAYDYVHPFWTLAERRESTTFWDVTAWYPPSSISRSPFYPQTALVAGFQGLAFEGEDALYWPSAARSLSRSIRALGGAIAGIGGSDSRLWHVMNPGAYRSVKAPPYDAPGSGRYLGNVSRVLGFGNPEAALKTRPNASTTWESQSYIDGTYLRGPRVGIATEREAFRVLKESAEVAISDEDSVLRLRVRAEFGWVRYPGWQYQYADGFEGRTPRAVFGPRVVTVEQFFPDGERGYVARTETWDFLTDGDPDFESQDFLGPAPTVESVPRIDPDEAVIVSPAYGSTDCLPATETRPIEGCAEAPNLETCHLPRHVRISLPYAETVDELAAGAELAIFESLEPQYSVELLGFFAAWVGRRYRLRWGPLELDHDLQVRELVHEGNFTEGAAGHPRTTLVGKLRIE